MTDNRATSPVEPLTKEPVYFGVVRLFGRDTPRRFFEIVPQYYFRADRIQELVYCTRIDNFPNGDAMINCPLSDLMRVYHALRQAGKLPPEDRGVTPKKEKESPDGR